MKAYVTPEEHARNHRRRWRQFLGLIIALLVLIGAVTIVRSGIGLIATLFDDSEQRQQYEDKLEGLVLFDPLPFDGIENIDDLTLREASVWGTVYSILETQGDFDNYSTDPDTEQLLLPSVEVDAYLAKLLGPSFRLTHQSFDMDDMTIEYDSAAQCYKIPITGSVGYYRASVVDMFKKGGRLHVTVGYVPIQSQEETILNTTDDTPTKYMDYLFSRQSGSWYLTGLTESDYAPPASSAADSVSSAPSQMAESEVQDAILASVDDGSPVYSGESDAASESASEAAASSDAASEAAAADEGTAQSAEASSGS